MGGAVPQARARVGGAREDPRSSTIGTSRRCRRSSGLYRQERRSAELVETLRRHINAVNDPAVRIDLYGADGPGLRGGAARHRPRDRGVQRHPQLRRRQQRARSARSVALVREDRGVGSRHRDGVAARRAHRRSRHARRPAPAHRPHLRGAAARSGYRRDALRRGARARSGVRAGDAVADGAVPEARRLAEGGADDGARRELHGNPLEKAQDCCSRRGASTARSSTTSCRRASCSRACSSSIPSTSRRASRWRRSTSATRSGPSSSPSSTCSCARSDQRKRQQGAQPALLPAGAHRRRARQRRQGAQATTSSPTTSTRRSCRRCSAAPRCSTRWRTGTAPSRSTRRSSSTTATRRKRRRSSTSSTGSATSS